MDKLGLPLLLIGIIWGLLMPILRVFELLNDRRDKILDPATKYTAAHRRLMFESDWKLLIYGVWTVFALTFLLALLSVGYLLDADAGPWAARAFYGIITLFFVVIAALGTWGGQRDLKAIKERLREMDEAGE